MGGNKMDKSPVTYRSYLLRLRRVDDAGRQTWRASLEAPGSGNQIYFENLEALCAYLATQMRPTEGRVDGQEPKTANVKLNQQIWYQTNNKK
jgi:hypothetical protein